MSNFARHIFSVARESHLGKKTPRAKKHKPHIYQFAFFWFYWSEKKEY